MASIHQGTIDFYKNSLINYINDKKEEHLLTEYTKCECLKLVDNIKTMDELDELVNKIEEIIQAESKKIELEKEKLIFENQKEEYFNKLRDDIYLLDNYPILKNKEQILEVLLNPMNEKELEYAKKYIRNIDDINNIRYNEVKDLDFDNSILLDYIVNRYNSYIQGKDFEKEKYESIEKLAQLSYELYYIAFMGQYELKEGFIKITNVDLDDKIESMRFDMIIDEIDIPKIIDKQPGKIDFDRNIEFYNEFHKVYEKNIDENIKMR